MSRDRVRPPRRAENEGVKRRCPQCGVNDLRVVVDEKGSRFVVSDCGLRVPVADLDDIRGW